MHYDSQMTETSTKCMKNPLDRLTELMTQIIYIHSTMRIFYK